MMIARRLTFGLILLTAGSALAQAPFTTEDVAKLRGVSALAVSPDGSRIAYVLDVPRQPFKDKDGPAWSELHVAAADGTSRPYVTGQVNVGAIEGPA